MRAAAVVHVVRSAEPRLNARYAPRQVEASRHENTDRELGVATRRAA